MKSSHLFYSIFFALTLFAHADHHRERSEHDDQIKDLEENFKSKAHQTHEAIQKGELSQAEGKKKLEKLKRTHSEKRRAMEFQRIRGRLDRGVEAGQISSEQADQRFAEMKELIHLKDRVAQEIHLEMEEEMATVMKEAQEGELNEEEAREEIEQMRMHFQHEIRMAHMEIDLDAEEARLDEAVADGRLSEDEMEERMVKMQERMERAEGEFRQRSEEAGHDDEEDHQEGSRWENEEELWERVASGLKAAVRLGRMSEGEARGIWEEWREEAQFEEDEEEYEDEED
ncbi:MAG: hypothetical protein ACJZ5X_03865 [Opitutales bacterium]